MCIFVDFCGILRLNLLHRFAEDHNCTELAKIGTSFIENHFPVIVGEEEFCDIPKNPLIKFLDSELIKVDSEYQVRFVALIWLVVKF